MILTFASQPLQSQRAHNSLDHLETITLIHHVRISYLAYARAPSVLIVELRARVMGAGIAVKKVK